MKTVYLVTFKQGCKPRQNKTFFDEDEAYNFAVKTNEIYGCAVLILKRKPNATKWLRVTTLFAKECC